MTEPPRFLQSIYSKYPDDQSPKEVFIQAAGHSYSGVGDRHVVIWWKNGEVADDDGVSKTVTQVIQLTGQAGNYAFYHPVSLLCSRVTVDTTENLQISMGTFTREQRDQMAAFAKDIVYDRKSVVNGCRVWTRDLFEAMVKAGLMSQDLFEKIDVAIPLVLRRPELKA
ncbi:hypothetical protein BDN70DRAFT_661385 [Pholiota conissans]|uniref:Uncharacterized protein n=1 Tax=Pholiota conissans TaxID=109636 RepID=A0A9P5Z382_9AGAR|nr:hypothetical protein BDN70DRAFT_661385 [Pholiota conissans]